MEPMEDMRSKKRARAKKRVEELKGFYIHLMVYVLINIMISLVIVVGQMYEGVSFTKAFFNFGTFSIWLFWGIGMLFHALKVFSYNPFFNKEWEQRQIEKYMRNDNSKEF